MSTVRQVFQAKWIAKDSNLPKEGTIGAAYIADGFYDEESAEYEAYLFDFGHEDGPCYCSREDFEVVQD